MTRLPVEIRPARPKDAAEIARIHVQAWQESYRGLLPDDLLARQDVSARQKIWEQALEQGQTRIVIAPGAGFAQLGPQREAEFAADWPLELWAMYLLDDAKRRGIGRALWAALAPQKPMTCCVLITNLPAIAFYEAIGGRRLLTRDEEIAGTPIREHVNGFAP
ncbi:GNAT family N-acetyltransferase [Palleronia caenipelagi]|nr:GNAT family N-acetyltransferase [Palleronia caenipelagi]